jgi:hypothetical protein
MLIASAGMLCLLFAPRLLAQETRAELNASATTPPVFQGLVVDAKGKTVGRLFYSPFYNNEATAIRQINGIWMSLPIASLSSGFGDAGNILVLVYYYQSTDCTGQAYLPVNPANSDVLAFGVPATVPPATQPSIYFAGTPWSVVPYNSYLTVGANPPCQASGLGRSIVGGPAQTVPVSSLGLTLPFSIK